MEMIRLTFLMNLVAGKLLRTQLYNSMMPLTLPFTEISNQFSLKYKMIFEI